MSQRDDITGLGWAALSGCVRHGDPERLEDVAVRQDRAAVIEEDHAVAEQAPALLVMRRTNVRGPGIRGLSWCAAGNVFTHVCVTSALVRGVVNMLVGDP